MNLLRNTRVYLAGPVEHDNHANDWRNVVTERLLKLGVNIYNPLAKPSWLHPLCKVHQSTYRNVLNGKSSDMTIADVFFANIEMRKLCLNMVASSDWVLCYLPIRFTAGTFEEIYLAANINKPVFFVVPDGMPSTWVLPIFATANDMDNVFFRSWDDFWKFIYRFDAGEIEYDPMKWLPLSYIAEFHNKTNDSSPLPPMGFNDTNV